MASADFDRRTQGFLQWFISLPGAQFSDLIEVVDLRSNNAGRGIIATQDIPADTTLFTIPRKAIINVETSELCNHIPQIFDLDAVPENEDDESKTLDSWSSLILVMIFEFLRGEQSPWKPYFDVLPETFDTPMFWSDAELAELQASAVRVKIGKSSAEGMFRTQILPVVRQYPELFAAVQGVSDEELIHLAHRMGSTIMAYAFDLEGEGDEEEENEEWVEDREGKSMMGMVPMADILNADAEFNAHINHGEDSLTATSLRPIRAGEEILNYYGPHPNSELLRRYGYVTERHARYDVVEIPWAVIEAALAAGLGLSLEALDQVRKQVDEEELEDTFVLERETGEPNPDGTFAITAAFREVPEDLDAQLKAFLKAIMKLSPESIPDKTKRDEVRQAVLLQTLQTLQSQYTTSIAEDHVKLRQSDLPQRLRMAIVVRLGEKLLLQEAKAKVQEVPVDVAESGRGKKAKLSS